MAKKKNDREVEVGQDTVDTGNTERDTLRGDTHTTGWESILDHIQKQDSAIAELSKKNTELEGTLKDLLTYLQKQQGAQMDPSQPQQQTGQSSLGMLGEIKGIIDTVRAQDKPLSMEARLAEMALTSMDLTNQYIRKRMIGEIENVSQQVQHTTVG